jgi:hypothetical protein
VHSDIRAVIVALDVARSRFPGAGSEALWTVGVAYHVEAKHGAYRPAPERTPHRASDSAIGSSTRPARKGVGERVDHGSRAAAVALPVCRVNVVAVACFYSSDNLGKGAALNAVQIAELVAQG